MTVFQRAQYRVTALVISLFVLASCSKKDGPSTLAGTTEFSFTGVNVSFTIDETAMKIQNADSLPYQYNVSALVANFKLVPGATVKVGTTVQQSGITANNFTQPVVYTVVAQDGVTTRNYTVQVNVAKVDPNTVAWQQVTANAGWSFYSTTAAYYNSKIYYSGRTISTGAWGVYSSADGATWSPLATVAVNNTDSIPGMESTMITFNNKLFLIGGQVGGFGSATNKVWSSTDGLTWTPSVVGTGEKRFVGRQRVPAVVFNNKLFVVGGSGYPSFGNLAYSGTNYRDVWSTSTGTTWDSVNAAPAFIARSSPALVVHKNKLWLIGGRTGTGITTADNYLNDVWTSADGNTWTQVTTSTTFTARWGHQVISYNNELFLIGGETFDGVQNDMWVSSDDGVNWTKVQAGNPRALPASFTGRTCFSAFVQDNTVWIVGGRGVKDGNGAYTLKSDIWKGKLVK